MQSYLIDPRDVIKFDRTEGELQLFWMFCLVVAGKTASTQARLLNDFLTKLPGETPFEKLTAVKFGLLERVKESRLGQYTRLAKAFSASLTLNLKTCTVDDLEAVYGCGPKTARMFLMMTRPNQRFAALDTHVLTHLRDNGIDAPRATPSAGPRYIMLEQEFLKLADASGMSVAEYDLSVWKKYSG